MTAKRMYLRISCHPDNVGVARTAVAAFAASLNFTVPDVEEIKVGVSEAVSNAVLHAYPDGDGEITVEAYCEQGNLVLVVEDFGVGIPDIIKACEPGFTTTSDHMGLGFSFMQSFMDALLLEAAPGKGTRVKMTKKLCRE